MKAYARNRQQFSHSNLMSVPKRIFIVPYRDREAHLKGFRERMTEYLGGDMVNNHICVVHQCDKRPFNRGAMKNIGFLAMKAKYHTHYKDITFIFHDVDSWPRENGMIPYETTDGVVAHYYGYRFALGGMFAIKGKDFEKTGGFPNFWGWGMEDNVMNRRCLDAGLTIDRSCFFLTSDRRIARPFDGYKRTMAKQEIVDYAKSRFDNMWEIRGISVCDSNAMLNVVAFEVAKDWKQLEYVQRDIREGTRVAVPKTKPRGGSGQRGRTWEMNLN